MDEGFVFPKKGLLSKLCKLQTPICNKNQNIKKAKVKIETYIKPSADANKISKPTILFRRNKFLKKNLFPTSAKTPSTRFSIINKVSEIFYSSTHSKNSIRCTHSYDKKENSYNKSCDSKQTINLLKHIEASAAKYFPLKAPESSISTMRFHSYPKPQVCSNIRIEGRKYRYKRKRAMISVCI